jgi:hypothetical protein
VQAKNYYGTQLALETMLNLGFKAIVLNLMLFFYLVNLFFILLDWMTKGTNYSCRE